MADAQTGQVISGSCYLSWPLTDKEREAGEYSKRVAKGNIYRIKARSWKGDAFSEPRWYVTELLEEDVPCCRFELEGQKYKQYTMAFFDVLFSSEEELVANLDSLDLTKPIIITTLNRHPQRGYGLHLTGNKTISFANIPNY